MPFSLAAPCLLSCTRVHQTRASAVKLSIVSAERVVSSVLTLRRGKALLLTNQLLLLQTPLHSTGSSPGRSCPAAATPPRATSLRSKKLLPCCWVWAGA